MTDKEKEKFISDLTTDVIKEVMQKIPQMPPEWDGWELRQYLADKFDESTLLKYRDKKRYKAYRNSFVVLNL